MNRTTFALFVALLIHFLFALIFWIFGTMVPEIKKPPEEKKIKISLKEMPVKEKQTKKIKQKIQQTEIASPMPKGSQLKELTQNAPIQYEPQKEVRMLQLNKEPKALKEKQIAKPKVEPLPLNKPYVYVQEAKLENNITKQVVKKETTKSENSLYSMLSEDKSSQEEEQKKKNQTQDGGNLSQDIKELYGDEFGKLTPGQQKYILDNKEIMRRITQQVLTRVANVNIPRDLNVNTSNIIEFYLHPNGDMTDFKFLSKSGYYVLDDTTKETIEYAYSRYPRPTEKTLIRYNVFYHLARY